MTVAWSPAWGTLGLVLLQVGAVSGQDQTKVGGFGVELVCLDTARRIVEPELRAFADNAHLWQQLDAQADGWGISHCWAWSETCPPQAVSAGEDPVAACSSGTGAPLEIKVEGFGDPAAPPPLGETGVDLEIVAAPVSMWRDVPYSRLPRKSGRSLAEFPRSGAAQWRIRASGDGLVSSWLDVPASQDWASLSLVRQKTYAVQVKVEGKALAAARVSLVESSRASPLAGAELLEFEVADDAGTVEVTLPEGESPAVILSSSGRLAVAYAQIDELPATVALPLGLSVAGRAVTAEGDPVAGVRLRGDSWVQDGFGLMQRHDAIAGVDGSFAVSGLSPGAAALRTVAGDLEFTRTLDLHASVDLGDIVLRSPEAAWLHVVSLASGASVPDARIRNAVGEWRTTNSDGLLRVPLAFGRNVLVAAEGHLLTQFDVPRRAGLTADDALVVALAPALVATGLFVAADGNTPAVEGRAIIRDEENPVLRQEVLGLDGSFYFSLPPGTYSVELSAANAGTRRLTVSGSAGDVVNLGVVVAPMAAWISGTVVDPAFSPVAGASISYTPPSESGPLVSWALGRTVATATDAEGYFELHGLAVGESTLRVEAAGFAPSEIVAGVKSTEWVDVGFIELSRGRLITVRSDIGRGTVELDVGATGHPRDQLTARFADGEASFEGVTPGPLGVRVLLNGIAVCEDRQAGGVDDAVVVCNDATVSVEGQVTMAGHPGDGMLIWRRTSDANIPEAVIQSGSGPLQRTDTVTANVQELQAMLDSEGRYYVDAILPGDWEVIWAPVRSGPQEAKQVSISRSPRRTMVDLRYDGVSLEGVVLDPEYRPVALATVDVFPTGSSVATDQDGRFQVLGLGPGTYQVRARQGHQQSDLVEAELLYSDDREVIELVLDDNPPQDELQISIRGGSSGLCFVEGESFSQQVVSIDAGRATVKLSPPLPRRLRVACRADGQWILDGWQDTRRTLTRGVTLDASQSQSAISLVGEQTPAVIQVTGPGGWDLGLLRQWFGGDARFRVGESILHLPVGEYHLRWSDQLRTVVTRHRRSVEVEISGP